jgi:hypothetical protein
MKYVAIAIVALLMARADLFLGIVDRLLEKSEPAPVEVDASGIKTNELVPVGKDQSLKQTTKQTFIALLEDFHGNPIPEIHDRAMTIFKENPTMFSQKLDPELESEIFRWRDLLNNNEPEAVKFMLDLMNILQGENLEMMKRFFSLWMEINMEHFIAAYSKTRDVNCSIAKTFGDNIPEEEKINEYVEREDALKIIVAKEKLDPVQKNLATNCLLVLQIEIAKIAPKPAPEEQPAPVAVDPNGVPEPVPAPEQVPTPDQGGVSP